jgi:hypothetical protein
MKQSQKQWVIAQLKANGEITRNQCLSRYISRLGAIACDLKAEGWELEAFSREGDYVYKLVKPATRAVYEFDLIDGVRKPRLTYQFL